MPHDPPDENEAFAEAVSDIEARNARRRRIFDPDSVLFRGGMVATILVAAVGGVWGIAIAFTAFKDGQKNNRDDIDKIREELVQTKKRVLVLRELDLWADALRTQNAGKMTVPRPSDYKVDP